MINVGREAMLSIGCIQAQRCHTGHCPTGVATQHPWLMRGLDPTLKSARLANYLVTLRKEVLALSRACGVPHPALVTADQLELLDDRFGAKTVAELFGYGRGFGLPSPTDCEEVRRLMTLVPDPQCGEIAQRRRRAVPAGGRFSPARPLCHEREA